MNIKIIVLLLSLLSCTLYAQDYSFIKTPRLKKIDISKGLSQNVILDMQIDKEGFLWAGTMDGLNKFDGYSFKIYKKEFKTDSSYVNNFIHKVWIDNNSNTWVIKEDGAYYINKQTNKINKVTINDEPPSRFGNACNDSIWIITRSQNLYKVNINNKSYRKVAKELKDFIKNNKDWVLNITQSDAHSVTMTTMRGSVIVYKNGKTYFYKNDKIDIKDFNSSCLDNDSNIWMTTYAGHLFKFDTDRKKFQLLSDSLFSNNHGLNFNCVYYDSLFNSIWISSQREGLFQYDLSKNTLGKYIIRAPQAKIIDSENILNMARDPHNKVLYLGSDQHGILVWDPYLYKFELIDPNRITTTDLGFRLPRKLASDNYGNVWIGSVNTGLWRYNRASDKLDVFTTSSHPDKIKYNSSVQLLHENDTLWVGHNGSGTSKYLLPELTLIDHFYVKGEEKELDNINVIWNFLKDSKNRLWIGTRSSGAYIKEGNKITSINKYNSILEDNIIYSIIEDPDKNIIICTQNGGLYKYDLATTKIAKIFPKENDLNKYASKSICFDKNGMIWYATDGKGLFLLDKDYNIIKQANSDNGILQNDAICSMILNDDNKLWASTNYGLYEISYDKDYNISSQIYTQLDGLTSNEFMTGAYLKTNDTLWMGNMEGVNYFVPKAIHKNPHKPRVYIKNVEINNRLTTDFEALKDLKSNEDNVSFEYNTIGFTLPDKTYYSNRLIGYDTVWSKPSLRTFSRYTNLAPGYYEFQVKARNYDGIWNETPVKTAFYIRPTIWQTLNFQIFIAMLFPLVAMLIYTSRVASIKKEERLKNQFTKEITEMEMRALRAQINPHFLFNTLNSINSYILQKDGKTASHYLVKFSKLMRLILGNSAQSFIKLSDEIDALDIYIEMEGMRFGNSFDYFLNIDKEINLNEILIPPMLLQPFVENAIWHGLMHKDGEKVLSIDISKTINGMIDITISDNGIGRAAAQKNKINKDERKSYGMDITRKRLELINSELSLKNEKVSTIQVTDLFNANGEACGTKVNVSIPYSGNLLVNDKYI